MGETISDWIIAMKDKGLDCSAEDLHSDKIKDYLIMKNSGLPVFSGLIIPYEKFRNENCEVKNFLNKYESFVVRAIPNTKELPRRYKIGVKSFEECDGFLRQKIELCQKEVYTILLTEHELNNKAGIIISNSRNTRVEIGGRLDKLSHGTEDPRASCIIDLTRVGHIENKTNWIIKGEEKLVQRVLKCIELSRDNFNPLFMRGYFELVVTETDKIRFLDYKTNEMYLK